MEQSDGSKELTLLQRILERFDQSKLAGAYSEMKTNLTLSEAESHRLDTYFHQKVEGLLECLTDVTVDGDDTEVRRLLSHIWIEFRMEWIRYNTQMQYQAMMKGEAQPLLMARGGALSYLIGLLEEFIPKDELYWVTKLAADPVPYLNSRTDVTSKLISISENVGAASTQIVDHFSKLKQSMSASQGQSQDFEKVIDEVEGLLSASTALPLNNLPEAFELTLSRRLRESPLPIVVIQESGQDEVSIPAETISGINGLFDQWLRSLISNSSEASIEARRAAGKTDHLQISWSISKGASGRITLLFKDDGLGLLESAPKPPNPDWTSAASSSKGNGSVLKITFRGTQTVSMLHLGVMRDGVLLSFAVPTECLVEMVQPKRVLLREGGGVSLAVIDKEVFPFVDLAKMLPSQQQGEVSQIQQQAFIKVKTSAGEVYVIKINEIFGQIRGVTKNGQIFAPYIEGYVLTKREFVSVIDVDLLKEVSCGGTVDQQAA